MKSKKIVKKTAKKFKKVVKKVKKEKSRGVSKKRPEAISQKNEQEVVDKDNRLELLRSISMIVAGKNTAPIADILIDKENVNEFLIAKKLDLTINQIRNVLYKLSDDGLVSFVRKKDKKKGWYTYFWTFDVEKAFLLLRKYVLRDIESLEHDLGSRKSKRYYKSPGINIEYSEERALELDFVCPETGEIMELKDNSQEIKELNSSLDKLKRKLVDIDSELVLILELKSKKVERKRKKDEKEKIAKRIAKRKATQAKNKKLAEKDKKKSKKKVKKKIVRAKKSKKKFKKKIKKKVFKKVKKVKKKKKR
jgi:transcription factor E